MGRQLWSTIFFALALSVSVSCSAPHAVNDDGLVVQPNSPDKNVIRDLPDVVKQIQQDWQEDYQSETVDPFKKTYAKVWVRMFPLLSVPYGDPFSETKNLNLLLLENTKGLKLRDDNTNQPMQYNCGKLTDTFYSILFQFSSNSMLLNGKCSMPLKALRVLPADKTTLTTASWDLLEWSSTPSSATPTKTQLRGAFVVRNIETYSGKGSPTSPDHAWSLIEVVSLNEYLRTVVPSEIPASWPNSALEAQAIAARTYAMREIIEAREVDHREFDLDPTTWFQSYRGTQFYDPDNKSWRTIEQPTTDAAVQSTYDQILTFGSQVIVAYFSGNSGGVTCTASECLQVPNNPAYLNFKPDASGVQNVSTGTWGASANITAQTIANRLSEMGIAFSARPTKLEHHVRGASGRTWQMQVLLQDGQRIVLDRLQTKRMMSMFGTIRSNLFELGDVDSATGKQRVVGHGYGHGVGMSQWGAKLFSDQGWSAEKIVKYYYDGTILQKLLSSYK